MISEKYVKKISCTYLKVTAELHPIILEDKKYEADELVQDDSTPLVAPALL